MQYNRKILTFLYCFLLVNSTIYSQKYVFKNYSIEDGLIQAFTLSMYQDNYGNFWFGTQGGVSKFDGNSFTSFDNRHGLAGNHVTAIFQDSEYNYWFGHRYNGITFYDPGNIGTGGKNFKNLHIISKRINCIAEDIYKNIWFGSGGDGIFLVNKQQFRSGSDDITDSTIFINITKKEGLTSNNIHSLISFNNGEVWAATDEGISIITAPPRYASLRGRPKSSPKGRTFIEKYSYKSITKENSNLPSNKIYSIIVDNDSTIWLSTNKGLVKMQRADKEYHFTLFTIPEELIGRNIFSEIISDKQGNIWGCSHVGAFMFNGKNFTKFSTKNGLLNNHVSAIVEDNEGNIWIATEGTGVSQYRGDKFTIYDKSTGLIDNQIASIIEDNKNNIWIATVKGVSKFMASPLTPLLRGEGDISLRTYEHFTTENGLITNNISVIFQDSRENIWFGAYSNNGLVRYNPKTKKTKVYTTKQGLLSNYILCINEDKQGNIWFSGLGTGCSKYIYSNNSKPEHFEQYTKADGLCSNSFWIIHRDKQGNLWFGSDDAGITKYDGKTFTTYNEKDGLKNHRAGAITHDSKNNIWLATIGGGIYKFNGKDFKNYTTKDGLSSDNPFLIVCDNNDIVWIGTNTGIDKFDPVSEIFTHFGKDEGFLAIETNQNAVCKDHNGNLWFGTVNGVVKLDPSKDLPNLVPPQTNILEVKLFFEEFNYLKYADTIDQVTRLPINLTLPYNKNHLTFEYIGISLTAPEKVNYHYKLENFDKDWMPITKSLKATYTNLPPGEYTFKVKACNNNCVWNDTPAAFTFKITPPFYKTMWFYILAFIGGAGIIYLIVFLRTKNIKKAKQVLEKKVKERTLEVLEQKEEILQQKEEIQVIIEEIKNQNKLLEETNVKILDHKNKLEQSNINITASIRYAKQIQDAILPPDDFIKKILPDYFIFYRPKDIISGDFYLIDKIDELIYIAAVDCTGHGVPGAFISIVGCNILNDALKEHNLDKPADILNDLNKGISEVFRKNYKETSVHDGMDIIYCNINPENLVLQYAGAYNPAYIVRNKQLIELKTDRFPIGSYFEDSQQKYSNNEFQLQKNDFLYLFTDGFSDQFGGPKEKKFKYKQFKELLVSVSHLKPDEQLEQLQRAFDKWKGNLEQIDDILVMGIRI